MNSITDIKKLFFKGDKEQPRVLPYPDELHISGILVQNDMVALDDVCVTQNVTRDIYCAKNIIICKGVEVIGNIYCKQCSLEGNVTGDISAYETLEVKKSAVLNGSIQTIQLSISSTAVLNGSITSISLKDSKQIYSSIWRKIDRIKYLNKERAEISTQIPSPAYFPPNYEEVILDPPAPKADLLPAIDNILPKIPVIDSFPANYEEVNLNPAAHKVDLPLEKENTLPELVGNSPVSYQETNLTSDMRKIDLSQEEEHRLPGKPVPDVQDTAEEVNLAPLAPKVDLSAKQEKKDVLFEIPLPGNTSEAFQEIKVPAVAQKIELPHERENALPEIPAPEYTQDAYKEVNLAPIVPKPDCSSKKEKDADTDGDNDKWW